MADALHIYLLGTFQCLRDGDPLTEFRSDKVRALLAYLAMQEARPVGRGTLANLFWADAGDRAAGSSLRQALSNLRRILPESSLTVTRQDVLLHTDHPRVWVDLLQFRELIAVSKRHEHPTLAHCTDCQTRLSKAAALYQEDFLAGFQTLAAEVFAEWRLPQQEMLHQEMLWLLEQLVEGAAGEPEEQIGYLRRLLALEPWQETAHRRLMALLAQTGRRGQALAQYESCHRILAAEFEALPEAETTALFEQIQAGEIGEIREEAAPFSGRADPEINTNLPAPTTAFVGRAAQLAEIQRLLSQNETRLLTIVGWTGMGKTRLAQVAATQQIAAFSGGVYFVSLAPPAVESTDEAEMQERLATAVCTRIDLPIPGRKEPFDTLIGFLQEKKLLLVLDNLEHLLPAAADFVVALLAEAPQLAILATSQVRLDCQAEVVLPLEGLALPMHVGASGTTPPAAESVQLFIDRARRQDPDFAPRDADWPAVVDLCRLLDGMPLAIELAATLVPHYTLNELVAAVGQDHHLLVTSWRDMPARHRTLQAAFSYAWKLLSPQAQQMLAQLSLFPGEFGREAALAVSEGTLQDLVVLVDRAMVRTARPGRYQLHDLIRQFARAELARTAQSEALVRARFERYFTALLAQQGAKLDSPDEVQALAAIELELDNLRLLRRQLMMRENWPALEGVVTALLRFYRGRGWYREGEQLLEELLPGLEGDPAAAPRLRSRLHCWQAVFWYGRGHFQQAASRLRELVPLFAAQTDPPYLARATFWLGRTELAIGEFAAAEEWLQRSLAQYRTIGNSRGLSRVLNALAHYHELLGQFGAAERYYAECLALNRELGIPQALASTLNNFGLLEYRLGNYAAAEAALREALTIHRTLENRLERAGSMGNLALVLIELEAYGRARALLEEARHILEELGNRSSLAIVLNNLGCAANGQERFTEAISFLRESLRLKQAEGNEQGRAFSLVHLGQAYMGLGEQERAQACFRDTLRLTGRLTLPPLALEALLGLAEMQVAAGEHAAALRLLQLPQHHQAAWQRTRRAAARLAEKTAAALDEESRRTAVAAGQALDLDEEMARWAG